MRNVHFSAARIARVICTLILFLGCRLFASDFTIWTEPKPALVFGGENKSLTLFIKNSANAPRRIKLDVRILQVTTIATAPLSERNKWKEISLNAGETSVEKFPLKLPEIRASTSLLLKFYEEGNVVEVSSIPLVVFPRNLLAKR